MTNLIIFSEEDIINVSSNLTAPESNNPQPPSDCPNTFLNFFPEISPPGSPFKAANVEAIKRCCQVLVHAKNCRAKECFRPKCGEMKRFFQHLRQCKQQQSGICEACKQFFAVCSHHANECTVGKCDVPFCEIIREKSKAVE